MPPKKTIVGKKSKTITKEPRDLREGHDIVVPNNTNSLYDLITSKEFININKDFAKNLIALYIYKMVYDAAAPRPVMAPQPEPDPIRRGVVVPARRGVVVEGRRADIIPPEQPAVNINESNEELQNRIKNIINATIESHSTEEGMGFTDGNALLHVGKEAFKALLLAGLAGAVGTYAIKSAENERNLNYDAENTTPYTVPPINSPYNLEERARNWTTEVKNERQMHDILSEFDDISDISSDSSRLSHFSSGSYGLGLKKKKAIVGDKPIIISDYELFTQVSQRVNNKIREGIKYIYEKSPDKKIIMTFIAVIFALGAALIFANSSSLTEEAINHIMNFGQILSDCANGRVTLNGVKAYVEHYVNMVMSRGGKLKPQRSKKSMTPGISAPEIKETFYEKRIKPIAKKAYDIITSDESITVAKTLAQIAFLTLVMYALKEAGTAGRNVIMRRYDEQRRIDDEAIRVQEEAERAQQLIIQELARREIEDEAIRQRINEDEVRQMEQERNERIARAIAEREQLERETQQTRNMTLEELEREGRNEWRERYNMLEEDLPYWQWKHIIKEHTDLPNFEQQAMYPREISDYHKRRLAKYAGKKFNPDISEAEYQSQVKDVLQRYPTLESYRNRSNQKNSQGKKPKGRGLNENIEYSKTELKKVAKKIYDTMKSKHGQDAIKGLTVATILAGLTTLLHSTIRSNPQHQLSPEELKEQYMNRLGEDVLFQ